MCSMIILFIALMLILLMCNTMSEKNIILTPQFGFTAGFLVSVGYGLFWVTRWELSLSWETFWILAGGNFLFAVVCIAVQQMGKKFTIKSKRITVLVSEKEDKNGTEIVVERWKVLLFLILQIAILVWTIYFLLRQVGGGLAGAIYSVNYAGKSNDEGISFPGLLSHLRNFSYASGFIWGYLLAHSVIYKYRSSRILLCANFVLSLINSMMSGGRIDAVLMITAFGVQIYFLWGNKSNWKKKLKNKTIIKVALLAVVFLLSFQSLGSLIGRNSELTLSEYVSEYLSAEIKNLDTFVRSGDFGAGDSFTTTQTFAHITNQLSGKYGLPVRTTKYSQPFQYINGYHLGNVYTIFWAFLYDGGYTALIVLTSLMAIIVSIFYNKTRKRKYRDDKISISLLIYSYMYFGCLFSFFSYWFYARVFNTKFIYYCVYWLVIKFFFERIKVENKH